MWFFLSLSPLSKEEVFSLPIIVRFLPSFLPSWFKRWISAFFTGYLITSDNTKFKGLTWLCGWEELLLLSKKVRERERERRKVMRNVVSSTIPWLLKLSVTLVFSFLLLVLHIHVEKEGKEEEKKFYLETRKGKRHDLHSKREGQKKTTVIEMDTFFIHSLSRSSLSLFFISFSLFFLSFLSLLSLFSLSSFSLFSLFFLFSLSFSLSHPLYFFWSNLIKWRRGELEKMLWDPKVSKSNEKREAPQTEWLITSAFKGWKIHIIRNRERREGRVNRRWTHISNGFNWLESDHR